MLCSVEDLKKLARDWRRAEAALATARRNLATALLTATEGGTPQRTLVEQTGINRETIRLMCAKARRERDEQSAPAE